MAESHGNSPAAWTGVALLLLGSALICLGIMFAMPLLWIPGVVLLPLGVVAWVGMNKAGYGVKPHGHDAGTDTRGAHSASH